jgi:hypothetical protein
MDLADQVSGSLLFSKQQKPKGRKSRCDLLEISPDCNQNYNHFKSSFVAWDMPSLRSFSLFRSSPH